MDLVKGRLFPSPLPGKQRPRRSKQRGTSTGIEQTGFTPGITFSQGSPLSAPPPKTQA